ncbi:MAG: hypothetical protein WCP35_09515 [Verrucomicrobiota bacterium]
MHSGLHGAAIIAARAVKDAGLDVIAAEPPPRHANLRGWPLAMDPEARKARRKALAIVIADQATFVDFTDG